MAITVEMSNDLHNSILIVDDEEIVTRSLSSFLSLEGDFDVRTAHSGAAGLEMLAASPADLVISDFLMPQMNGLDFLARVKEHHPDTVRVLLTGYSDRENAIRAINEIGLFQYMEKPWDNDQLSLVIRNGLATRRLETQLNRKIDELDRAQVAHDKLSQQHDELRDELTMARKIQQMMLPTVIPHADKIGVHTLFEPAFDVGGDILDTIPLTGSHFAVMVADATGHGIQAALTTMLMKSAFQEFHGTPTSSRDMLAKMNESFHRVFPPQVFAGVMIAVVAPENGTVRIANGGLLRPLLSRADGTVEVVMADGLLLGVVDKSAFRVGNEVVVSLHPGDRLILFSDGIAEIERDGEEFGRAPMNKLLADRAIPAAELPQALLSAARDYARPDHEWDDVTIVVMERH